MPSGESFNPLDKKHLGESVAQRLMQADALPLPLADKFKGAGVYALFYHGKHPAYKPLVKANQDGRAIPIYVGKAVPPGARKGGFGLGLNPGSALFSRIGQHASSIAEATNLNVNDFTCRYLTVDDIWIPLGESMLISQFEPVWNKVIDGFGNHDPGKGRHQQQTSPWDVLHPGRAWAKKCSANPVTPQELTANSLKHIKAFLEGN